MPRNKRSSHDTTPSNAAAKESKSRRGGRTKPAVAETAPVPAVAIEEVAVKDSTKTKPRAATTHRKKTVSEPVVTELTSSQPNFTPAAISADVTPQEQIVPKFTITREDIARLAFSYWERRGYQGGSAEEDWRRAERELKSLLGD